MTIEKGVTTEKYSPYPLISHHFSVTLPHITIRKDLSMKKQLFTLACLLWAGGMLSITAQDAPQPGQQPHPQGQFQPQGGQHPQGQPPRPEHQGEQGPRRRPQFDPAHPSVHDPVMAKEDGTYYLFSTGRGISVMSSTDMKTWKRERPVFSEGPAWAMELVPGFRGHIWAPDIIRHNGRWHIFYSCSAFGKNTSVIGHASTASLNPESPEYGWTDHGKVVQSVPGRDNWNAIDANIIIDEEGTPWMNFGSFWDGIKLFRLTDDLNAPAQPEEWRTIARKRGSQSTETEPGDNAIEAPFIFRHGEYYYLLVSHDYCCKGVESTYKIAVGRAKEVQGPYLDKEGRRLDQGGGTIIARGNDRYAGVGHCAAYTFDGADYLIAHAYDLNKNGMSVLVVRPITWDSEGWPAIEL